MECLGGNGYVEESPLPRLYREAPVNAIWEGSGNIMALDVLRAASRDRDAAHGVLAELSREAQGLPGVEQSAKCIESGLAGPDAEGASRIVTQELAALATAAALARCAPGEIAEAFARTRLANQRAIFGTNELDAQHEQLLERALPSG